MKTPRHFCCGRPAAGSALIITLFFIVLITLVTVGFLSTSRVERTVATSHLEKMRAASFAREGVENVVGTLRKETAYRYNYQDPTNNFQTVSYFRNFVTQPGAIIVPEQVADAAKQKELRKVVPLSTGQSTALKPADPVLAPPELNVQILSDLTSNSHVITDVGDNATGAASTMRLKWVYLRQIKNPTASQSSFEYDFSETPDLNLTDKPIVGRMAYWADDESTKINYNLAWKRSPEGSTATNSNTSAYSHPSRISLLALHSGNEGIADAIHNFTVTGASKRYFNSFADARQVDALNPGAGISSVIDFNKFELTHYNHDPDTTFFGEDRILLTTNRDLVPKNKDGTYARKFLDIMRDDKPANQLDPGVLGDLGGAAKFDKVIRNVLRYISTTNWPLAPGKSFKDKYYPTTPDSEARLGQLAVNIIDYVRAKESKQPWIAPLRYALDGSGLYSYDPGVAYGTSNSYQGVCRAPYITEVGMHMEDVKDSSAGNRYPCTFVMELFLPKNYGFVDAAGNETSIDLAQPATATTSGWFCLWTETEYTDTGGTGGAKRGYYYKNSKGNLIAMSGHATRGVPITASDIFCDSGTRLKPGHYVTVQKRFYRDWSYGDRPKLSNRSAIFYGTVGSDEMLGGSLNNWPRINIATQWEPVAYTMANPAQTLNRFDRVPSVQTDDPRASVNPLDWVATANNTFFRYDPLTGSYVGGPNTAASTLGKAATGRKTEPQQDTDLNGFITDASLYMPPPKGAKGNEQGRVTSLGELGYVNTGVDSRSGKPSMPWRTIRLQPNRYSDANTLPDWAFTDLFAVPNPDLTNAASIYTPHGTSIGGRVNINSHVEPFALMKRDRGLVGLLMGAKSLKGSPETVAKAIYDRKLSPLKNFNYGKVYGYPWKPSPGAGESNAYDTPGEICEIEGVADGGEQSEDLMREIGSLITARGGVFSIYSIGQALVQTPNGKLVVTSEQRLQSVVERYIDNRETVTTADDKVRFRTVYTRNLTP